VDKDRESIFERNVGVYSRISSHDKVHGVHHRVWQARRHTSNSTYAHSLGYITKSHRALCRYADEAYWVVYLRHLEFGSLVILNVVFDNQTHETIEL